MDKPNALSLQEDHAVGIQDDNKMVLIIPPEQIASTTLHIATDGICEDRDGILFTRSGKIYIPED